MWSDIKEVRGWIKLAVAAILLLQMAFLWYGQRSAAQATAGLVTPAALEESQAQQLQVQQVALQTLKAELLADGFAITDTLYSEIWLAISDLRMEQRITNERVAELLKVNQHVKNAVDRNLIETLDKLDQMRRDKNKLEMERQIQQDLAELRRMMEERQQVDTPKKDRIK